MLNVGNKYNTAISSALIYNIFILVENDECSTLVTRSNKIIMIIAVGMGNSFYSLEMKLVV